MEKLTPVKNTDRQYDQAVEECKDIFLKKTRDYGTSWRIMRLPSITDQIFIKAQRIRTIDLKGEKMVNEEMDVEFLGIANYGIMALIQMELGDKEGTEISYDEALRLFDKKIKEAYDIMLAKNHDYGEAWRDMRISSLTDLILMKILRVKQIEDNKGQTLASEGIKANYQDMLNYSVFALIKLTP